MVKYLLISLFLCSIAVTSSLAESNAPSSIKSAASASQPIVYPNPVVDKLFYNTDYIYQSIEIYDLSGNLRLSVNSFDEPFIDVSSLKASLYLIKIVSSNGVNISKLTVKR